MRNETLIGATIARLISHLARQVTEDRAVDLLAETALTLRRKFPVSVLKTMRLVLDLAIDGNPNETSKEEKGKTQAKPRTTSREFRR